MTEPTISEGRIIEEINLAEEDEVECLEDVMTLDASEGDVVMGEEEVVAEEEHDQDEIVDITPPPEMYVFYNFSLELEFTI